MFGEAGPGRDMAGVQPNMSELQKLVNMQPATLPPEGLAAHVGDTPGKQPPSPHTSSSTTSSACIESTKTASGAVTATSTASSGTCESKTPSPTQTPPNSRASPLHTGSPSVKDRSSPACTVSSTATTTTSATAVSATTNTPTTPTSAVNNANNEFSPRASVHSGPRPSVNSVPLPPVPPGPRPGCDVAQQPIRPPPPSQSARGPAPSMVGREQMSPVRVASPGQQQMRPARPGSSGTPTGMSPGMAGVKSPGCRTPPPFSAPATRIPNPITRC